MLIPGRDELAVSCSCPDAGGAPGLLCKHAIAVLLVLADETSIEPELLIRWRTPAGEGAGPPPGVAHLPRRGRAIGGPPARVDPLAGMLDSPNPMPTLPQVPVRPVAVPPAASLDDPTARLVYELYADAVAVMSRRR
jgi:hypothetical protein